MQQVEKFVEMVEICIDVLSNKSPNIEDLQIKLTETLSKKSKGVDRFYEHEKKWSYDKSDEEKIKIICNGILLLEKFITIDLARLFHRWFKSHPTWKQNADFDKLYHTSYDVNLFVKFIKTLHYSDLHRCLEECINNDFPDEIVIEMMK